MKTWIALVALFAGSIYSSFAVDKNGNGMSDVWEALYGASALPPDGDADGDGFTNAQEARAGTNPFDANSYPRLQFTTMFSANAVLLSWDSAPGKRYTIQSRTNLFAGNWTNETQIIAS